MAAEDFSTVPNIEADSTHLISRPRSTSVVDREIHQFNVDFERSLAAYRGTMKAWLNTPANSAEHDLLWKRGSVLNEELYELSDEIISLNSSLRRRELGDPADGDSNSTLLRPADTKQPCEPSREALDEVTFPLYWQARTSLIRQFVAGLSLITCPNEGPCRFCRVSFDTTRDRLVRLSCGHVVGKECLPKCLEISNDCPLCPRPVFDCVEPEYKFSMSEYEFWEEMNSSLNAEQVKNLLRIQEETDADYFGLRELAGSGLEHTDAFWVEVHELRSLWKVYELRLI